MRGGGPILKHVPGSTRGSRIRNLFSYFVIFLCAVLIVEVSAASFGFQAFDGWLFAWVFIAISVVYFGTVVVLVIYFTSRDFRLSPRRLARDTILSIAFTILAFAVFHRNAGITLSGHCPEVHRPVDTLYFSAVTFSTLGHGDFRPCPEASARLVAAFQAIFANLHLGLVVGAAFFFAQDQGDRDEAETGPMPMASKDEIDHPGNENDTRYPEDHDRGG